MSLGRLMDVPMWRCCCVMWAYVNLYLWERRTLTNLWPPNKKWTYGEPFSFFSPNKAHSVTTYSEEGVKRNVRGEIFFCCLWCEKQNGCQDMRHMEKWKWFKNLWGVGAVTRTLGEVWQRFNALPFFISRHSCLIRYNSRSSYNPDCEKDSASHISFCRLRRGRAFRLLTVSGACLYITPTKLTYSWPDKWTASSLLQ